MARTLSRNGRVFLADVLHGNEKLADAVNHLLVVGFYLVNLGFVALYLSGDGTIDDTRGVFEALSTKLGVVLLVLGVMHLANVYVLNRIRRRGVMEREQVPPVAAAGLDVAAARDRGVSTMTTPARRPPAAADAARRVPVRRLTVLYDAACSLCALPERLAAPAAAAGAAGVRAGGLRARPAPAPRPRPPRHPRRDHRRRRRAARSTGGPPPGSSPCGRCVSTAPLAHRLATPAGAKVARAAVLAAAKWRQGHAARPRLGRGRLPPRRRVDVRPVRRAGPTPARLCRRRLRH